MNKQSVGGESSSEVSHQNQTWDLGMAYGILFGLWPLNNKATPKLRPLVIRCRWLLVPIFSQFTKTAKVGEMCEKELSVFYTVLYCYSSCNPCILHFSCDPRLGTTRSRQVQFESLDLGKCNEYIFRPCKKRSRKTDLEIWSWKIKQKQKTLLSPATL